MSILSEVADQSPSADIERQLRELHDYYALQVNGAVEEGRERDVDGPVASQPDEPPRLIEEYQTI